MAESLRTKTKCIGKRVSFPYHTQCIAPPQTTLLFMHPAWNTLDLGGVESPILPSFLPRTSTREPEKHGVSSAIALWFPRAHAGGGRTVQRSSPSVQSPGFTPTPPEHTLIPTRKPESQEIGSDSCCRLKGGWTFCTCCSIIAQQTRPQKDHKRCNVGLYFYMHINNSVYTYSPSDSKVCEYHQSPTLQRGGG